MGKKQKVDTKGPVAKKPRKNFKQALSSPYAVEWKPLSEDDTELILTRLRSETHIRKRKKKEKYKHPNICIGTNEVTKALEKDELALVICCRKVQPYVLVQHIPVQCYLQQTPICSLGSKGSPFRLGKIFGLRTAVVLGFKKSGIEEFKSLFEFCIPKTTSVKIPWLPQAAQPVKYQKTNIEQRKQQKLE